MLRGDVCWPFVRVSAYHLGIFRARRYDEEGGAGKEQRKFTKT
jgi:hypothetical protein